MSIKRVMVPDIGEVTIVKRRGVRNLSLSVNAKGLVRVSIPVWAPYSAGTLFAQKRSEWIAGHLEKYKQPDLRHGQLIGKVHRLIFEKATAKTTTTRVNVNEIRISTPLAFSDSQVQDKARLACEKALKNEAQSMLPERLKNLASQYGLRYKEVRIRKLTSRWGSCSRDKTISLSFYLMQLPWKQIDHVLLHELVHTKHLNHGPSFWKKFDEIIPGAKQERKELKKHKPQLLPL